MKLRIFFGTFNGNHNSINNLYINIVNSGYVVIRAGLFSNNRGTISNLKLVNANLYLKADLGYLAGISGRNSIKNIQWTNLHKLC